MNIPEHPQIARCLETGYPEPYTPIQCADCQEEVSGDEPLYLWDNEYICENCLRDRISENFDMRTLAEMLDIPWKSAYLVEV